MILIKVFIQRTIVSGEITLSAYTHARTHTHTGASTHEYILTMHNLEYKQTWSWGKNGRSTVLEKELRSDLKESRGRVYVGEKGDFQ